MPGFKNITFDDRDTDRLRYLPPNGGWFLTGSWNASSVGETGTLASSREPVANVTFTFPEPATGFYYYGIPRCCGGMYAICIDCDPVRPNFIPIDAVNRTDDGQNPPVILFSQTWDKPGIHEIILTNQNDPRFGTGSSMITIDRFELTVVDPNASPSSATTSTAGTTGTATTPKATSAPSGSSSKNVVGPAIGGAVGGLVLIALLALFFILAKRRRKRKADMQIEQPMQHTYAPRVSSLAANQHYYPAPSTSAPSTTGYTSSSGSRPYPKTSISGLSAASHPLSSTTSGTRRTRPPRRETDAGIVLSSDDEYDQRESTLPPEYNQVFSRTGESTSAATTSAGATNPDPNPSNRIPPLQGKF